MNGTVLTANELLERAARVVVGRHAALLGARRTVGATEAELNQRVDEGAAQLARLDDELHPTFFCRA